MQRKIYGFDSNYSSSKVHQKKVIHFFYNIGRTILLKIHFPQLSNRDRIRNSHSRSLPFNNSFFLCCKCNAILIRDMLVGGLILIPKFPVPTLPRLAVSHTNNNTGNLRQSSGAETCRSLSFLCAEYLGGEGKACEFLFVRSWRCCTESKR